MNNDNNVKNRRVEIPTGFTFVEVIVALAIVSISLLGLIRLHLISIRMVEAAEVTSQAVLLAEEKIAEALALGYPKEGTKSGTVERNALLFIPISGVRNAVTRGMAIIKMEE